jgi:hypothetical protein
MRTTALFLAGTAALTLAACGSETSGEFTTEDGKNAEYTIDKDSGETSMTIKGEDGEETLRAGSNVPVSLPAGFTLFPGTRVVNNMVVNKSGEQGTMIIFEADAPADKVVAHYRDAAKAAGFEIEVEVNTNGTLTVAGERKSDGSKLSITATSGTPTTGQLVIAATKTG